VTTHSF